MPFRLNPANRLPCLFDNRNHLFDRASYTTQKVAIISGVAFACLCSTVWSAIKNMPRVAGAIAIGGICLEIALMILLPGRNSIKKVAPLQENFAPSPDLTALIKELEKCYPIKAIDPALLRDKQKGGIMGQACGDAIGLFTEFTTQKEAEEMIDGKPIDLGKAYPDKFIKGYNWHHIKRFIKNGWTDDTDQALSLLRALYRDLKMNDEKEPFANLFAQELMKWRTGGLQTETPFIGRQHPYCMGLGALVSAVLDEDDFVENPKGAAENQWAKKPQELLQNRPAANGAIMRTAPIGIIFYQSFADLMHYTFEACKVTHADPRCTASCIALTLAIALCLRGHDYKTVIEGAEKGALAVLKAELQRAADENKLAMAESQDIDTLYENVATELKDHLHGTWTTLDLDEGYKDQSKTNKIGYTFKCMGAAFYALYLAVKDQTDGRSDIFRCIIEEIAAQGGDADTNGAAAGALLGAYLGYKNQFPSNWTDELADRPVIEQAMEHIEELTKLYGEKQG